MTALYCRDCQHWQQEITEADGTRHGYGRHKLEDGSLVDIGVCLRSRGLHLVKVENEPACARFEPDERLVMPWDASSR